MDWDDWRFFLTVSRTNSIRAAAQELGVNHATVSRRIEHMENQLRMVLFERKARGYQLSAEGEAILPQALEIEQKFSAMRQRIRGLENTSSGHIKVAFSDGIVSTVIPLLHRFRAENPNIHLNLCIGNAANDIGTSEAHLSLRFIVSPPEGMAGRRVGKFATANYAAKTLMTKGVSGDAMDQIPWIGWEDVWSHLPSAQWLARHISSEHVVCRVNSSYAMYFAVQSGIGAGHLLCIEADQDPLLVRIGEQQFDDSNTLWIITHPELRRLSRVQKLMHFLTEEIRQLYKHVIAL
jgi:DNA-binding transcriptional LysR family regulator